MDDMNRDNFTSSFNENLPENVSSYPFSPLVLSSAVKREPLSPQEVYPGSASSAAPNFILPSFQETYSTHQELLGEHQTFFTGPLPAVAAQNYGQRFPMVADLDYQFSEGNHATYHTNRDFYLKKELTSEPCLTYPSLDYFQLPGNNFTSFLSGPNSHKSNASFHPGRNSSGSFPAQLREALQGTLIGSKNKGITNKQPERCSSTKRFVFKISDIFSDGSWSKIFDPGRAQVGLAIYGLGLNLENFP